MKKVYVNFLVEFLRLVAALLAGLGGGQILQ